MRTLIREAAKSTPERPLWWWRAYDRFDREIGFGMTDSEAEAREQAEAAVARPGRVRHD